MLLFSWMSYKRLFLRVRCRYLTDYKRISHEVFVGVTLRIAEHTVEAAEARWIADPFIDQLRLIYLLLFTLLSLL